MTASKTFVAGVVAVAIAGAANAQILGIELTAAAQQKNATWLQEHNGKKVVVCEEISGLDTESKPGTILIGKEVVVVVPDPAKPDLVLSEVTEKGKKVVAKNRELKLLQADIATNGIKTLFPSETLAGLRTEFVRKKLAIETKRSASKPLKLGSPEWFESHRAILAEVDSLVGWLRATVFGAAADKMAKDYAAELKKQGDAASKSRLETAKVHKPLTVPADLMEKSAAFGHRDLKWLGRESMHFRILSTDVLSDSKIGEGLVLAERILEKFRRTFIDPFVGEDYSDPVPEGVFLDWFMAPEDEELGTRFYEEYIGRKIGEPRDRAIKLKGHGGRGGRADYSMFWRFGGDSDLDAIIAHQTGHALANMAFNRGDQGGMPSWLNEGFAFWTAFEHISRNSVNCVAFAVESYARAKDKEGEKFNEQGLRAVLNQLALDKGPPLDQLLRMKLVEMETKDISKAWSFLDYLIATDTKKAVAFFRACCQSMGKNDNPDLVKLRPKAMEIYDVHDGSDVLGVLDDKWRRFAATGQKK